MKKLLSFLPSNYREAPPAVSSPDDPNRLTEEIEKVIPDSPQRAYDMKRIIRQVADHNDFFEIQEDFAKNIIIGFIRLGGASVGVIANQPMVSAGSLDIDASDKSARFIRFCDAFNIPILNLVDCPGYLPGKQQEYGGIIRHGAKTLYAYCEATVPRVSVIVRKIYGGAMSGMAVSKLVGTDFTIALTTAEIAIMGPEAAANVIFKDEIAKAEDPKAMRIQKVNEYRQKFANPYVAAEEGWIDAIIEPKDMRAYLIATFEQLKGKVELRPGKTARDHPAVDYNTEWRGRMIKKIEHIGVAVANIEKSVHIFRDLLGIPLEKVYESDAIKTKIAFFPLGDSTIELIEPMDPSSPAAKFIEKRGEGIHHICLGVEDIEAALREFEAKGIELLNKTPRKTADGRIIAFLSPKSTNGVLIELMQLGAEE